MTFRQLNKTVIQGLTPLKQNTRPLISVLRAKCRLKFTPEATRPAGTLPLMIPAI